MMSPALSGLRPGPPRGPRSPAGEVRGGGASPPFSAVLSSWPKGAAARCQERSEASQAGPLARPTATGYAAERPAGRFPSLYGTGEPCTSPIRNKRFCASCRTICPTPSPLTPTSRPPRA
ncbi:MAG: hypothetical protein DBX67_02430 [Desulfovibrionaceae bacterium]|nr:MAG: hypothetical protein DBX67_02430 [Desulfovibrionaceae bacterium]